MKTTLCIALGGAIGSVGRYWIALWMMPLSRHLPWGTIAVNVAGSFAIAFFGTLTLMNGRYPVPDIWRLAFMAGICGGFTTFSSFSLQTLELLREGATMRALLNIVLSVILCIAAAALGHAAAEKLNGAKPEIARNDPAPRG